MGLLTLTGKRFSEESMLLREDRAGEATGRSEFDSVLLRIFKGDNSLPDMMRECRCLGGDIMFSLSGPDDGPASLEVGLCSIASVVAVALVEVAVVVVVLVVVDCSV